MGKFKNFHEDRINEGSLNRTNFKDNLDRYEKFKQKIKDGGNFQLVDRSEVVIDPSILKILTDDPQSIPKLIPTTQGLLSLGKFQKTTEFGSNIGSTNIRGDKTTFQEVGFCLALDSLINGKKLDLENYVPSGNLKISSDYKITLEFLKQNPDWYKTSIKGAGAVERIFGNLRPYEIHHDSKKFNEIRKIGQKLSKASTADKWNPSDVYLIKSFQPPTDSIISYNEYIGKGSDVLGFSLKKGQKSALHGAFSLQNTCNYFSLGKLKTKYSDVETAKKYIKKYMSVIKVGKIASRTMVHLVDDNKSILENIDLLEPKAKNFLKSLPQSLQFLTFLEKTNEEIDDIIKFAVLTAMSLSPISCRHYKIEGDKFSTIPSGKDVEIKLNNIRIKLNGEADIIFDIDLNGKPSKFQLRSKGSLPQFMLIKKGDTARKAIPLTTIHFK